MIGHSLQIGGETSGECDSHDLCLCYVIMVVLSQAHRLRGEEHQKDRRIDHTQMNASFI